MTDDESLRDLIADLAASGPGESEAGELPDVWSKITELGLDAIGVSEEAGGSGGTVAHLAVIVESLGLAGIGVPIIEVATARWILANANENAVSAELPIVVLTQGHGDSHVVPAVPWGRSADMLIYYASDGPPTRYSLREGVTVSPDTNLAGEQHDTLDLTGVDGNVLNAAPDAGAVRDRLGLLWAAAITGAVRGAYAATKGYVSTREQFGAPLVKLPAVASALANFRVHVSLAEAALARAVASAGVDDHVEPTAVASARIVAATSATEAARLAHQLHGAIGITAEAELHRLTTRLWAWQDAVTTEREWSMALAQSALEGGEETVWSELTTAT